MGLTVDPEGKGDKGVESVRALVVLNKAAAVAPTTTLVLGCSRRTPLPRPFKLFKGTAVGRVVTDQVDIGIAVEIWVGIEFAGD